MPLTRIEYENLIKNIPTTWKETINNTNKTKIKYPTQTLKEIIKLIPHREGTWIRDNEGHVGLVEDGSPKILHAFSGKAGRHDGLAKILKTLGIQCQEMDTLIRTNRHDLCDDKIFQRTLRRAKHGYYTAGIFGVPCSTFSVARIGADGINEPTSIRDRENPKGITELTTEQQKELDNANLLVERSVIIALAIANRGGSVLFENPCDRGDRTAQDSIIRDRYEVRYKDHASLWNHPTMIRMKETLNLKSVTFPQCALGGKYQKWTTLWYSTDMANELNKLHICTCRRGHTHAEIARGRDERGKWRSAEAAAYPEQMNKTIARAIKEAITAQENRGTLFKNNVRAWWKISKEGHLKKIGLENPINKNDEAIGEEVHVWEKKALAACTEELEAWEREEEEGVANTTMWCSGNIIDWNLVEETTTPSGTKQCNGSVNPGHWWWEHGTTDRKREPTLISDIQTHETYMTMLSHQFDPMRTFRKGPSGEANREHTNWVDLLTKDLQDTEYNMQYVVAHMETSNFKTTYRVRWEGFDGSWDTWEPEEKLEGTEILTDYLKSLNEDDTNEILEELPKTENEQEEGWIKQLRLRLMTHRISHGINKLTASKWESVWADANPIGNGRCKKRE